MGHNVRLPSRRLDRQFVKTSSCLDFTFVEANRLEEWLSYSQDHTFAVIAFGTSLHNLPRPGNCPMLSIDLPQLTEPSKVEVWTSNQPVQMIHHDHFHAGSNGVVAAAFLSIEESPNEALETTTSRAYHRLLTELRALGYPYLWRVWNYFPRINELSDGLERYQRFCMGRYDAFLEMLPEFPVSAPAGTAIGTASGPLLVYALAGIHPAQHLGNPRQVHAYEYPQTYGPRSPSFSRATIAAGGGAAQLFLAGTASVIGHASQHVGSAQAQTQETLNNIRAVLRHAQDACAASSALNPSRGIYKVYFRDQEDEEQIRQVIDDSPLGLTHPLFLQGDLCRRELLVEIEGVMS